MSRIENGNKLFRVQGLGSYVFIWMRGEIPLFGIAQDRGKCKMNIGQGKETPSAIFRQACPVAFRFDCQRPSAFVDESERKELRECGQ